VVALLSQGMAPECHFENSVESIGSPVSSSGGGLPGRPDLAKRSGRSSFGGKKSAVSYLVLGLRPETSDWAR
jgi:hypothetical protein